MAKLYQYQGGSIQGQQVIQPDKDPNILGAVAKFGSDALNKIAKDQFILGHDNLVNDILETAYKENPTDPKGFYDMVQSGIEKSTRNLPGDMARQIRLSVDKKARALNADIQNNYKQVQISNVEQQLTKQIDTLTKDGPLSLKQYNLNMMKAMVNRDEDAMAALRAGYNENKQTLAAIADYQIDGSYVIGKESTRNMLKAAQFGKMDAFLEITESLSKDELKSFYENIFQDKKRFMDAFDIDYKTWDEMDKRTLSRIKAFNKEYKHVLKSQDAFNATRMAQGLTDDEIDEIESHGTLSKETIDGLRKVKKALNKQGIKPEKAFNFGDQNEGYLAAIMEIQDVVNSKDDGSPEYADRLLQAGVKASIAIQKLQNAGLSEEAAQIAQRSLMESMASQDFAEILDVSDSSLISELTRKAKTDFDNRHKLPAGIPDKWQDSSIRRDTYINPATGNVSYFAPKISDDIQRGLRAQAADIFKAAIIAASQGKYELARQIRNDGNRELIYKKYSQYIPRQAFAQMENELANGRKAYYTLNNAVFEYRGVSQNDVVMIGRF